MKAKPLAERQVTAVHEHGHVGHPAGEQGRGPEFMLSIPDGHAVLTTHPGR
jgi:hypothetical protein